MSKLWSAVDDYFNAELNADDEVMTGIPAQNEHGEEEFAAQSKHLHLLAKIKEAKSILEIGSLGGYSTLWLGKSLPEEGKMASLESNAEYAEIAERNITGAGLEDKVEVIHAPAEDTLPRLLERGYPRFDFIYIDANQALYPDYLEAAIDMAKCGSLIITERKIEDRFEEEANGPEMQRFLKILKDEPRIDATALQTVGAKGHDGFIMAVLD